MTVDAVDIDPAIIDIAALLCPQNGKWLDPAHRRWLCIIAEGKRKYDIIYMDAFLNPLSTPIQQGRICD